MPEPSIDGTKRTFPALLVALSLRVETFLHNSAATFGSAPHDLYCPSARNVLHARHVICFRFASWVMLRNHTTTPKQQTMQNKVAQPTTRAGRPLLFFSSRSVFFRSPGCLGLFTKKNVKSGFLEDTNSAIAEINLRV